MQAATKYMAPQMHTWAKEQTEGSPLLTRDVLTMMLSQRLYAFTLPTGRILWPMPARSDVSESLDTIAANIGDTLYRGPNGWESRAAGTGNPQGFVEILDQLVTSPIAGIDLLNLEPYTDIVVFAEGIALSGSSWRNFVVSVNNGASWFTANGDYLLNELNGTLTSRTDIGGHATATGNARTVIAEFTRLPNKPGLICQTTLGSYYQIFQASLLPVNAIRLRAAGAQNITAGRVLAYAR